LIADKSNKRARAKEIWDKLVTEYDDRKTRAHAVYYLALQNYELGKVNAEETTKILDKVRIIWRGDRFEYELLKKLGDVYLAGGNNISALRTYREAVLNFPKHPDNEMLTERMRIAYANALTKDLSTPDKTFEAVALYYEFQELKPAGEDGDKITGELAEKLADYDLLKEAADLMEKSIEKISVPEDKALVATRVAILRYMNHNPQLALDMLNKSELKTIPAYIQNERDILAVNAMADLGQNDAAWKLVTKLPPERGKQVKAEILWKNKQWREMLVLYESMADKTLADIMKIAIAKAMIDDKKGLADLQKEYAGRMQKSEYADLFKFTTDSGEIDYHNLPASLNLDSAKKLVDIYKSRLKKGGVGALAPEKKSAELPKAAAVTKK
jgi:predicted negative regulator of RcsB-dependent stress response